MSEPAVTHYARDDDLQPICGDGRKGDLMSFFVSDTTCPACQEFVGPQPTYGGKTLQQLRDAATGRSS